MAGILSIRTCGIALACAGGIYASVVGLAEAASGAVVRGGASITVQNQYVSDSGVRYAPPFSPVEFEIELRNTGGGSPGDSRFSFAVPAGLTELVWICTPIEGADCAITEGSGAIVDQSIESIGPGGAILYRVIAQQLGEVPPYIESTASVDLDAGATCSDGQTSPCTSLARVPTGANFNSSLFGMRTLSGGASFEFLASHSGDSRPASNTRIFSEIPAGVKTYTWTCTPFKGSIPCPAPSGVGEIDQVVPVWPEGGELRYTIDAVLDPMATDDLSVTVLVTPENGSSCGEEASAPPCVAIEVLPGAPRILLTHAAEALESGLIAYEVGIVNPGSSSAYLIVNNPTPEGIDDLIDFTCEASDAAECPSDPTLEFREIFLPAGGALTFNFTGVRDAVTPLPVITSTVTVQMPKGGLCGESLSAPPCTASATTGLLGSLLVTKTSNVELIVPSQLVEYTIDITNNSPIPLTNVEIRDDVPDGIAAFESWTCTSSVVGECPSASGSGALLETVPAISPNAQLTYTIQARAADEVPSYVQNVAEVMFEAGGVICAEPKSSPPCLAFSGLPSAITYTVTKTADKAELDAGVLNYELRIVKVGGGTFGVHIADTIPAGISDFSWTCFAEMGLCPETSGTGSIDFELADVPPGELEIVFSVQATLDASPPSEIINTLTVTPDAGNPVALTGLPPRSRCLADGVVTLPPCVAVATTSLAQTVSIVKTSSDMQLLRGGVANYLVTVSNEGVGVGEVSVLDAVADGLATMQWQCTGYFGVTCPAASGVGAIDLTFASFPANSRVELDIVGEVALDAPTTIINTASVVPPSTATCSPAGCSASVALPVVNSPSPNFDLTLVADVSQATPAQAIVYTLDVRNLGEIPAKGAALNVPVPTGISSFVWSCVGEECPAPSGTGAIAEEIPFLPVYSALMNQGRLLYTITALVSDAPPATIALAATIVPGSLGSCVGGICTVSVVTPVLSAESAVIAISMSADRSEVAPGESVVYEVTLSNDSATDAAAITFTNPLAAGLSALTWQCSAVGNARCPQAGGSGPINQTISNLPANAAVLYSITANVSATATSTITNTARVAPSDSSTCNPSSCSVSVSTAVGTQVGPDIALRNARAYSAAGINGTLVDVVNVSGAAASNVPVRLTPASSRRLLAAYASGCTASPGSTGSVVVSCPNPGTTSGVRCLEGVCTIEQLASGQAVTLFVALNDGTTATLRAEGTNDINELNDSIALPIGGTP